LLRSLRGLSCLLLLDDGLGPFDDIGGQLHASRSAGEEVITHRVVCVLVVRDRTHDGIVEVRGLGELGRTVGLCPRRRAHGQKASNRTGPPTPPLDPQHTCPPRPREETRPQDSACAGTQAHTTQVADEFALPGTSTSNRSLSGLHTSSDTVDPPSGAASTKASWTGRSRRAWPGPGTSSEVAGPGGGSVGEDVRAWPAGRLVRGEGQVDPYV